MIGNSRSQLARDKSVPALIGSSALVPQATA
jgi:hypothetical protein